MLERRLNIMPLSDAARKMDGIYRTQRHIYDLTRKYYLLGRDRLISGLHANPDTLVLEIGCGTGRNLMLAAKLWPHARLYGLDISHAMLDTARAALARYRVTDRIMLAHADATDFAGRVPFSVARFDRVFLSYTLSMIPGWQVALEEAVAMLAPGGSVHIVDFGQQERLPAIFRHALFAWLAKFDVSPRADLRPVLEDLAIRHDMTLVFTPLYRGYAWQAVLTKTS